MSRYDGLIIPRSYSEYINKTDAATLQQALQLSGVLSAIVAAGDNKAVTSNAVYEALANYQKRITFTVTSSNNFEMPITQFYSSWIIGGLAQGIGGISEFLNLSEWDVTKNYGFVKLEYSASERKLIISSTSDSASKITLLFLNGV